MSATEHDVAMCNVDVEFNGTIRFDDVEYDACLVNAHIQEFFGACTEGLPRLTFELWCNVSDFFGETILFEAFAEFREMLRDALGEDEADDMLEDGLTETSLSCMEASLLKYLMKLAKEKSDKGITEV